MADIADKTAMECTPATKITFTPQHMATNTKEGSELMQSHMEHRPLAVSSCPDLPVLLPGLYSVTRYDQRNKSFRSSKNIAMKRRNDRALFGTPKVSRLGSRDEEERKVQKMGAIVPKSITRRRQRVRKLDGLDHTSNKNRLREKLWKDLSRFGLWPMEGPGDYADEQSVETTVEAIWDQWQDTEDRTSLIDASSGSSDAWGYGFKDGKILEEDNDASEVFLTGVTSVISSAVPGTTKLHFKETVNGKQLSAPTDGDSDFDTLREENNIDEEEEKSELGLLAARLHTKVRTPGLERRKRLSDLNHFLSTQLQKRLFRAWGTIKSAFTGSGEMTVDQIIKFLKHSDVQLGEKDTAKVHKILEDHAPAILAARDGSEEENGNNYIKCGRIENKIVFSYNDFHKIFYPIDPHEALRWKRELDRDKLRQGQEKEIYSRELEALEEKVRQRLASSAERIIDVLKHFECDPRSIPWESEQQRLQLRSTLFDIIFRTSHCRQIPQPGSRLSHRYLTRSLDIRSVPNKLCVKLVLSALLQKYSRNGHFEGIEVTTAAYLYHDFATDIIKQSVRRYWEKSKIDQWPERQMIFYFRIKKRSFFDWRIFADRSRVLCRHLLRKFVVWKYLTRKIHERNAFYRISFWPFYVWKRYLQQMIIARGKTFFLMKVLRTYVLLRCIRALKLRLIKKQWGKDQIVRMRKKKRKHICRVCWVSWKTQSQSSHLKRQSWQKYGYMLQKRHELYMVTTAFYVLRYYSILEKGMKRHKFKLFSRSIFVRSRGEIKAHDLYQKHKTNFVDYTDQQQGSLILGVNERAKSSLIHPLDILSCESGISIEKRNVQNFNLLLSAKNNESVQSNLHVDGLCAESGNSIMETTFEKTIQRKDQLYRMCLNLYQLYCKQDQINMVGNVIAYRRHGRIFIKNLRKLTHRRKINRFAIDLGAFRVASSCFRQWISGTIHRPPPATREDVSKPVIKWDETEEASNRISLKWRADREWRIHAIADNPMQAQQLCKNHSNIMKNDMLRMENIRGRELILKSMQANEDEFLAKETKATLKIKAIQMQQAKGLILRRARRLYDAMDNVYDIFLQQQKKQQLKSSFRSLRIVAMMKYINALCRRAQIRNWLRLCHRFMYWEKYMSAFYKHKLKYYVFQTLLKHAVWKWKFQSPGLSCKLQRSQELLWKYEHYLQTHGMLDGTSESFRLVGTKYSPANSFQGTFLRWVQFTQCSRARNGIVLLARRKQEIWLMHKVFFAFKIRVKVRYTFNQRCAIPPYLWRQNKVDLDIFLCKVIAVEQRLPTTKLRIQLASSQKLMRKTAISLPTLKKKFQDDEKEVRQQILLE